MRKWGLMIVLAYVLGMLVMPVPAGASGFALPEQGNAAMGLSGAFTAQADDTTAVWYNPAGLTQLEGTSVAGGIVTIAPSFEHKTTAGITEKISDKTHVTGHVYAAGALADGLAWGFGINTPFGLSTDWPVTSSTRFIATFSEIKTVNLNPNIAYKASDDLSIAAGIDYIMLDATMSKMLQLGPAGTPNFKLSGDGTGWGANLAALYKASDALKAGISYRSRIKVKVEGNAEIESGPLASSNPGSTEITLPDVITLGVSYAVSDQLTLNGNLDRTLWSTYDRLNITSATFIPLTGGSSTVVEEKQWKDTWCFRVGAQYQLDDAWKLRAGMLYDQNPVPELHFETRVPDSDRIGISIGAGYTTGNMTIDASYMYLMFRDRTIGESDADILPGLGDTDLLNGTYQASAHLAGVTLSYRF